MLCYLRHLLEFRESPTPQTARNGSPEIIFDSNIFGNDLHEMSAPRAKMYLFYVVNICCYRCAVNSIRQCVSTRTARAWVA